MSRTLLPAADPGETRVGRPPPGRRNHAPSAAAISTAATSIARVRTKPGVCGVCGDLVAVDRGRLARDLTRFILKIGVELRVFSWSGTRMYTPESLQLSRTFI